VKKCCYAIVWKRQLIITCLCCIVGILSHKLLVLTFILPQINIVFEKIKYLTHLARFWNKCGLTYPDDRSTVFNYISFIKIFELYDAFFHIFHN
jgi:hypothetical protein